jgi:hypothetical protein
MTNPARRRLSAFAALLLGVALAGVVPAVAAPSEEGGTATDKQVAALSAYWQASAKAAKAPAATKSPILRSTLLAKASPDECYAGMGAPYPSVSVDKKGNFVCLEGGQPKVNQAYVWGLTKAGDDLWFGTGANILCLVLGAYLGQTSGIETESYTCELGESYFGTTHGLPPEIGDFRPPDLFVYDQTAKTLTNVEGLLDTAGKALLSSTLGIRSAGSIGDRVFLAGPSILGGLNVFVYNTDGTYVGSETIAGFTNIRKWVNVQGHLYTGVGTSTGGQVLRYTGSTAEDPFQYETVGTLTTEPAELAEHDGRLFASTWPNLANLQPTEAGQASLWMSALIGDDGFLDADSAWQRVWRAGSYEPDPITAMTYGGGALVSFGGQLYWGTMHVPFTAALAHAQLYPSTGTDATIANVLGSHRAIAIFRGDDFATEGEYVELLYGAATLPAFDGTTLEWTEQPNNMGGATPTYGAAGFGNTFNNYTWTMGVFGGQLYVGTMDWSYLLADGLPLLAEELGLPPGTELPLSVPESGFGADLWRFPSSAAAAVAERIEGVGNYTNYGIRTMVSDDALYLGSANPMNLMTDRTDDRPEGGWELLRLK